METAPDNKNSNTSKVAIAVALALIGLLTVATIIISGNNKEAKKPAIEHKKDQKAQSHISPPTDAVSIIKVAQLNGLDKFFWLGEPLPKEQVRVDLLRRPAQLEVGYLDPKAQEDFSPVSPSFTTLVVTQPFTSGRSLAVLKKLSSGIIERNGYSVYLPPAQFLKQRRIFAVSNDLKTVGIILSTGKATIPALEAIAERVQLSDVRPQQEK